MPKKATAKDAELIMQLYDLRREPELRKARHWWTMEFWPSNADDFLKVVSAAGTQENTWMRQASSYWSMAATFVHCGALNADLFLQPTVSGEAYVIYAKVQPFLKELREKVGDPHLFRAIEEVLNSTKFGRERVKLTLQRMVQAKERIAAAKAQPRNS